MERWRRSHGVVGVNAPSWLTFEVHRTYFDGAATDRTVIQARAGVLAARRFEERDPTGLRFGMNMPAGYRRLLVQESRLHAYAAATPADLPVTLASPAWARMADAYRDRDALDAVDRAGLAHWLIAVCLPGAVTDVVPADLDPAACRDDEVLATTQAARAVALFQAEGITERATAAYRVLADDPAPTLTHAQAVASYGYVLARHAADASAAEDLGRRARGLLAAAAGALDPFTHTVATVRLVLREVLRLERERDFDGAAHLLADAAGEIARLEAAAPEDAMVLLESRRRLVDRRLEIAVRRGDDDGRDAALAEGLALDPTCVKIRMQAAQAHQRSGRHDEALDGFLHAARLGPHGTGFALLQAADCARAAGHAELARVLAERAFRAAPRSARTAELLTGVLESEGDAPIAGVVRRVARRVPERPWENNWLFQMYGAYFNLSESHSPALYARLPGIAHESAAAGAAPGITFQRLMPPAFRANLVRESGLTDFAVKHPADLPERLRTPAWEQLCAWTAGFPGDTPERQLLTASLLFRLGFGALVQELVPARPAAELSGAPELLLHHWRDLVRYVGSVGRGVAAPTTSFDIGLHPDCPVRLRFVVAVFAVVYHARETKDVAEAVAWRDRGRAALDELLADPATTPLDRLMLESRYYRSVTYVPFLQRDERRLTDEMERAEVLARRIRAATPYEEFLRRENLRACLESRSKEAIGFGHHDLAHARTEEVVAIDPYEPKSHIERAESLARRGEHRAAADSYLRAARLGPHSTATSYALAGECFDRAGLPGPAEDCFVQSLRVDPYAVTAARGWARVARDADSATLAAEYRDGLEAWAAERRAARARTAPAPSPATA